MKKMLIGLGCYLATSFFSVNANELEIRMKDLTTEANLGVITLVPTPYGVLFDIKLEGLPYGTHGFHIHTFPSCEPQVVNEELILGGAAGGHYDPQMTNKHGSPWSYSNHLGDLPALYVDRQGRAVNAVLAPRLRLEDLSRRSLVIHQGSDNYADQPNTNGGSGSRIACGVIGYIKRK
ncbi:superoxide dismutase family protein [Vibrio harveyi]|uniref:superoxide dismutase family protein n=1 Tax=Vibrio harveyi TaxID=669 RepID=UPI003CF00EF1